VDILGDIVLNPLFDPAEMAKEKKVIFEEINMVEDTPDDLVMENLTGAFWPDHPLGRPILGTKKSVSAFKRDQLASFFKGAYRPSNIVVAAAGHLEHEAAAGLVKRHFEALEKGGAKRDGGPPRPASKIVARSKKELEQVHVVLGAPSYPHGHRDRYGAYIMNTVLGGSMSSRLFQNIREKRGLAYSISSGVTAYSDAGILTVYAGASLESVDEVVRLTMDECRRMIDEPMPADELRRAKDHLKGSLMLSLENTGSRMSHLARQEIYFRRHFSLDEIMAGIEAVEAGDVRRIAAEIFGGELSMSVLGNLGKYRPKRSLLRI
jgi:predicted Zn-dependent peptidase